MAISATCRVCAPQARPFPKVSVPRVIDAAMVSEHVLVMSELQGGSLLDGLKRMAQAYAEAQGISVETLKEQMAASAKADGGDPLGGAAGPSRLKLALLQGYVRTSTLAVNTGVALYNGSIGRIAKESKKKYSTSRRRDSNSGGFQQICSRSG